MKTNIHHKEWNEHNFLSLSWIGLGCLLVFSQRFPQCDERVPIAKHRHRFCLWKSVVATTILCKFTWYLGKHQQTDRHTPCHSHDFAVISLCCVRLSLSCKFKTVVIVYWPISISQPVIDCRFAWNQYWFIVHVRRSVWTYIFYECEDKRRVRVSCSIPEKKKERHIAKQKHRFAVWFKKWQAVTYVTGTHM